MEELLEKIDLWLDIDDNRKNFFLVVGGGIFVAGLFFVVLGLFVAKNTFFSLIGGMLSVVGFFSIYYNWKN